MDTPALVALDIFFLVFHSAFVLFNVTGWAWERTRRLHLVATTLTIASWFGLGAVYGWGYCPCTDWHWDVKRALGETDLPWSYIKYYADRATGIAWDPGVVDVTVVIVGVTTFALSIILNTRDASRRRQEFEKNRGTRSHSGR